MTGWTTFEERETQGNRIQGQKSFKRPCAPIESVRKLDFGRKQADDIEVVPAGATHQKQRDQQVYNRANVAMGTARQHDCA